MTGILEIRPIVVKEQKEDEEIDEDEQEVNLDKIEEEMEAYYSSEGEDNDMVWVQAHSQVNSAGPTTDKTTDSVNFIFYFY